MWEHTEDKRHIISFLTVNSIYVSSGASSIEFNGIYSQLTQWHLKAEMKQLTVKTPWALVERIRITYETNTLFYDLRDHFVLFSLRLYNHIYIFLPATRSTLMFLNDYLF